MEGSEWFCSNKITLGLRWWNNWAPSPPALGVMWQEDMCPLSAHMMGRSPQIQSYHFIYLLKPRWAHSPIYLENGKFPRLFLEDTGKNIISWWRTPKASTCAVSESLCKSRHMALPGLETSGIDNSVWAVGLPSARVSFCLIPFCVYIVARKKGGEGEDPRTVAVAWLWIWFSGLLWIYEHSTKNPSSIMRFVIRRNLAAVPILAQYSSGKLQAANPSPWKSQLVEGQVGSSHGCPWALTTPSKGNSLMEKHSKQDGFHNVCIVRGRV